MQKRVSTSFRWASGGCRPCAHAAAVLGRPEQEVVCVTIMASAALSKKSRPRGLKFELGARQERDSGNHTFRVEVQGPRPRTHATLAVGGVKT